MYALKGCNNHFVLLCKRFCMQWRLISHRTNLNFRRYRAIYLRSFILSECSTLKAQHSVPILKPHATDFIHFYVKNKLLIT